MHTLFIKAEYIVNSRPSIYISSGTTDFLLGNKIISPINFLNQQKVNFELKTIPQAVPTAGEKIIQWRKALQTARTYFISQWHKSYLTSLQARYNQSHKQV